MSRPDPTPAALPVEGAPRPSHPPLVASAMGAIGATFAVLAGGWLMLAPFALGYQPAGADWADPTYADFWAGLGLLVLGVIVLLISAVDLVGRLRAAGAVSGARPEPVAAEPAGPPPPAADDELTSLLKPLIAALSQDSQRAGSSNGSHAPSVDPANREMPR